MKMDGLLFLWSADIPIKNDPSFEPGNYGFGKLSKLVRSLKYVEVQEKSSDNTSGVNIQVRLKGA
jgi:hypothetical protein